MGDRKRIPEAVNAAVLASARRRCCICVALAGDLAEKRGQIAHLDRDPSNADPDNLVFLCLEHHDAYDTRPSQSKGLTVQEVKRYREELPASLARGSTVSLAPDVRVAASCALAGTRPGVAEGVLAVSVENHSGSSVFIRDIRLELADRQHLFVPRDYLTGELNSRRELRSGERMAFHISLSALFAAGRTPAEFVAVVAADDINRTFEFRGHELGTIMRALHAEHLRTNDGAA